MGSRVAGFFGSGKSKPSNGYGFSDEYIREKFNAGHRAETQLASALKDKEDAIAKYHALRFCVGGFFAVLAIFILKLGGKTNLNQKAA